MMTAERIAPSFTRVSRSAVVGTERGSFVPNDRPGLQEDASIRMRRDRCVVRNEHERRVFALAHVYQQVEYPRSRRAVQTDKEAVIAPAVGPQRRAQRQGRKVGGICPPATS